MIVRLSILSATVSLLMLASGAVTMAAEGALRARDGVIPAGGPLPLSLQNEVEAAIDRSVTWLLARQAADGSWGSSNQAAVTALTVLALEGADSRAGVSNAVANALAWLRMASPDGTEAAAWRSLALRQAPDATAAATPLEAAMLRFAWSTLAQPPPVALTRSPAAGSNLVLRCAWAMAAEGPAADSLLAELAMRWPERHRPLAPRLGRNRQLWILSRGINAAGGRLNAPDGTALAWRTDLAADLVAAQQRDPAVPGGACWPAGNTDDWADAQPAATSFGLLVLREL